MLIYSRVTSARLFAAFGLLLITVCPAPASSTPLATTQDKPASLRDQIDAIVQGLKIKGAKVGVVVYSTKADQAVYGVNEREPLLLASNTKLLTTSAALARLG